MPERARRYLQRYGEDEHGVAKLLQGLHWKRVAVIPVCHEGVLLQNALQSLRMAARGEPTLVVLVINAPVSASASTRQANHALWLQLSAVDAVDVTCADTPMLHVSGEAGVDLLLIDRSSHDALRIPDKQGVGRARKIGCDVALALWSVGNIEIPWIWCTDADVDVPPSYFDIPPADAVAATLPFVHRAGTDALGEALQLYEIWLRYHVLCLARAGSPYAFHTIGSTIVVGMSGYASVRGFPRRNATEDFYLLNKLAKIGGVMRLSGPPIALQFRPSDRVPVGTGPAMARIASSRAAGTAYCLPHPDSYAALGTWLSALNDLAVHRELERFRNQIDGHPALRGVLGRMAMKSPLENALESSSLHERVHRHLHTGFDGLRTIQLLHDAQRSLEPLPWRVALRRAVPELLCDVERAPVAEVAARLAEVETTLHERFAGLASMK